MGAQRRRAYMAASEGRSRWTLPHTYTSDEAIDVAHSGPCNEVRNEPERQEQDGGQQGGGARRRRSEGETWCAVVERSGLPSPTLAAATPHFTTLQSTRPRLVSRWDLGKTTCCGTLRITPGTTTRRGRVNDLVIAPSPNGKPIAWYRPPARAA